LRRLKPVPVRPIVSGEVPTHPDKPDGFDEAARRRSLAVDEAVERARRARFEAHGELRRVRDAARRATSVPPPRRRTPR
jgi:hypothetical protein